MEGTQMATRGVFVVLIVLFGFGVPALADRPRPEGAACRKDLECASRRCGLTHGDWICMAPKTNNSPRSSPSTRSTPSTGDDDAEPASAPRPSLSEQATRCRTSDAVYSRRQGKSERWAMEKFSILLSECGYSCDLGTTASCVVLQRNTRFCATAPYCLELCSAAGDSPSLKRAFGCTTRQPATKPIRPRRT